MTLRYCSPLGALLLVLISCGSSQRGPKDADDDIDQCAALPPGAAAEPLPTPTSRLGAAAAISEAWLQRRLASEVPTNLASAKNQAIGAAGRVSYTITRSGFAIDANDNGLVVSTKLRGQIDVCKPVGPFCVAYGSCQPGWSVNIAIPTDYEKDASLRTQAQVVVTEGCVLRPVGYNATGELKKITRKQERSVRKQIARELRAIENQLEQGWQRIRGGIALPGGECLDVTPERLTFTTPQKQDGVLTAAVELQGSLALGCEHQADEADEAIGHSRTDPATVLPRPTKATQLEPTIELSVSVPLSLEALEHQVSEAVGAKLGWAVRAATPQPTHDDSSDDSAKPTSKNHLFMTTSADPQCPGWVRVTPGVVDNVLRLEPAVLDASAAAKVAELRLPLPESFEHLDKAYARLNDELSTARARASAQGLDLAIEHKRSYTVDVGPEQLRLALRVTGTANLQDTPAAGNGDRAEGSQ